MLAEQNIAVVFKPDAAVIANSMYWEYLDDNIRPYMKKRGTRIDHHKIASLVELIVATFLPILHDEVAVQRRYNALLAFHCAMNVMKAWGHPIQRKHMETAFVTSHHDFLEYTAATLQMPVFSNAATWYLVEKLADSIQSKFADPYLAGKSLLNPGSPVSEM